MVPWCERRAALCRSMRPRLRGPAARGPVAGGRGPIPAGIPRKGARASILARVALAMAVLGTAGCRMPERAALARVEDGGACPDAGGPRVCVAVEAAAGGPHGVGFRGPGGTWIERPLLPGECLVFPREAHGRPVRIRPPHGGGRARRILLRAGKKAVIGRRWRGRRVRYEPCGP